jgi:hypothetical protein
LLAAGRAGTVDEVGQRFLESGVALIARAERACNEMSVLLEVDTIYRRIRRKAGTVEDQELELPGQWKLPAPGRTPANDASVDKHEPLHGSSLQL